MAKARRHSNPRRLPASIQVQEQRAYDEGYGPRNRRHYSRSSREWEEDPDFAAVDIRLSAPSQLKANVHEYNNLVAAVANLGFTSREMKELLKDVDKATSAGDWMLASSETHPDGNYRSAIREARERFTDMLLDRMIEENEEAMSREGGTPIW